MEIRNYGIPIIGVGMFGFRFGLDLLGCLQMNNFKVGFNLCDFNFSMSGFHC